MEATATKAPTPAWRAATNRALLRWFGRAGRPLAFRGTRDPYALLVAEVMLQQTQASRVEPAWRAFLDRFPTVTDLADATPAAVIRAWAGLGYNRRAVRLQAAARVISGTYGGVVPRDPALLERLPGVGPYTARAIAATAFRSAVAGVDTNIARVVGRVFGLHADASPAVVQRLADHWIARGRPDTWTHALMDVGATLCRPRRPACDGCPLRSYCRYAAESTASGAHVDERRPRSAGGRRSTARPFPATRRWLRGQLVARLRNASHGRWLDLEGPLGTHDGEAVATALAELARDGLLERDPRGWVRLPVEHS